MASQLRNQLRNGAMATKLEFLRLWGFRRAFPSWEMRGGGVLRNSTRVPRGCFAVAKIFTEGGYGGAK